LHVPGPGAAEDSRAEEDVTMGHGGDVITELTSDHREVDEMFERMNALPQGDKQRKDLVDNATIELVRHSVAEEMYLYPAVRQHLPDGDRIADKELEDHAGVERLLKDLESMQPDDGDFDRLVGKLQGEVTEHVRDEEQRLFTMLREHCPQEMLDELGDKVRQAKKTAPTRPHPASPDTPPGNKLLAPGAGLLDRARDAFTGRGKSS
jgi:hemerythrin superfamily protein